MALPEQQNLRRLYEESSILSPDYANIHVQTSGEGQPLHAIRQAHFFNHYGVEDHQRHLAAMVEGGLSIPETQIEVIDGIGYMATAWITQVDIPRLEYYPKLREAVQGLDNYKQWVEATNEKYILYDAFDLQQFTYGTVHPDEEPRVWFFDVEPRVKDVRAFAENADDLHALIDFYTQIEQTRNDNV